MSEQTDPVDVVLSAERAAVTTGWVPTERVRVRREVITEEVTLTVSVRREVLRVERQPLRDGSNGLRGVDAPAAGEAAPHAVPDAAGGEQVLEVVLSAERPVVSVEVVPYECVRVGVRSVATTTPVSVDLRREAVDLTAEAHVRPSFHGVPGGG